MYELAILAISVCTVIASALIYKKASGEPVFKLNMLNYSFWILSITALFGTVLAVMADMFPQIVEGGEHYGDKTHRLLVWMMVIWVLLGLPSGAVASNFVFNIRGVAQRAQKFRDARIPPGWRLSERALFRMVFISSMILCPIFYYQVASGETALGEAVSTGSILDAQIIRRESRSEINIPLFDFFFSTGTVQWLSFIAFAMAFSVNRLKWWILSAALFAAMAYLSVVDASVSRVLYYLVGILFLRSLCGGPFIRWYEVIAFVVLTELMFVILKGSDLGFIANVVGPVYGRIVFGQMIGTYLSLEMFPYAHDFIGFSSTGRIIHEWLGLPFSESYGLIMMGIYDPTAVDKGYGGHLTTMFMG